MLFIISIQIFGATCCCLIMATDNYDDLIHIKIMINQNDYSLS